MKQTEASEIFGGVRLTYISSHTALPPGTQPGRDDRLEILYCHDGRMEYASGRQTAMLGARDMLVCVRPGDTHPDAFSCERCHGLLVTVDLRRAAESMRHVLNDLNISLDALQQKYGLPDRATLFRANASLNQIFSPVFTAPDNVRISYAKVKFPELLLFLDTFRPKEPSAARKRCFSKYAITQTRLVGQYLAENTQQPVTLIELSLRFGLSQTVLKECFKQTFGESISTFSRRMRMEQAAELLLSSDGNILDIALQVGYANASKFAKAFREVYGCNPNEYRRQKG